MAVEVAVHQMIASALVDRAVEAMVLSTQMKVLLELTILAVVEAVVLGKALKTAQKVETVL